MDYRRAGRPERRLRNCPKGTFELAEEQDDGQVYNVRITIATTDSSVDLRNNPDQATDPSTPAGTA